MQGTADCVFGISASQLIAGHALVCSICSSIFPTLPIVLQLQFNHNSQQGIQDLIDGKADVALGKADITSDMVASHQISSMDIFKCLTSVCLHPCHRDYNSSNAAHDQHHSFCSVACAEAEKVQLNVVPGVICGYHKQLHTMQCLAYDCQNANCKVMSERDRR